MAPRKSKKKFMYIVCYSYTNARAERAVGIVNIVYRYKKMAEAHMDRLKSDNEMNVSYPVYYIQELEVK